MACQAVIRSGPRRGSLCGRPVYYPTNFCAQYHYRPHLPDSSESLLLQQQFRDEEKKEEEKKLTNHSRGYPNYASRPVTEPTLVAQNELFQARNAREALEARERELRASQDARERIIGIPNRVPTGIPEETRNTSEQQVARILSLMNTKQRELKGIVEIPWYKKLFFCQDTFQEAEDSRMATQRIANDCAICTSAPQNREYWIKLKCGHYYHCECAYEWIGSFSNIDKGCPLCRSTIVNNQFLIVLSK
jgi:hypothetical protein